WITSEGVCLDSAFALHRRDQYRRCPAGPRLSNDLFQVPLVNSQRVGRAIFHVIMTELHEQPVVRSYLAEDFLEAPRAKGTFDGLTRFGIICNGDVRAKNRGS